MLKSHKLALWMIAAAASLFALGLFAIQTLTSSDHLRQLVHDHVWKTYQRELKAGALSLKLTPVPELHATDVSISNPDWSHDKTLITAKHFSARIQLLPLLIGRVTVDRLAVDDFTLNLQTAPDGRRSWDAQRPLPSAANESSSQPILANLPLRAFTLHNGTIHYYNQHDEETKWEVEQAQLAARSGWRNVSVKLRVVRDGHALQVDGQFDNLSQLGVKDVTTHGSVRMQAGSTSMVIDGELPLDPKLHRYQLHAAIDADSLDEAFGLTGIARRSHAAIKAQLNLHAADDRIEVQDWQVQLGKLHVTGDAHIDLSGDLPVFEAHLHADRLDWVQALLDAGMPPLPPKPKGELFYDNPLPWSQLAATRGVRGTVHTSIQWLKMRSGIELTNVTGDMKFADGHLNIPAFKANLLGGSASGSATLSGHQQTAHVDLHLDNTLLGKWFLETHKKVPIVGGRMQVHATVDVQGKSLKALAASITGPLTIAIESATVDSKKLSDAETWLNGLTPLFSTKEPDQFELACMGARLPFEHGIARGGGIIGMQSQANQLLMSGSVDLREQSYALHGRVRARSGVALGVSTFARKLKVDGKIAAPHVGLDKSAAPAAIARIAAAVLTSGASIIGTTLWDSMQSPPNPCEVALETHTPSTQKTKAPTVQPSAQGK